MRLVSLRNSPSSPTAMSTALVHAQRAFQSRSSSHPSPSSQPLHHRPQLQPESDPDLGPDLPPLCLTQTPSSSSPSRPPTPPPSHQQSPTSPPRRPRANIPLSSPTLRPAGFWNIAESCHLGATLAALAALPSIHAYARGRSPPLFAALDASRRGAARALDPRAAAEAIAGENWAARDSQDAHETLGRVLEVLEFGDVGRGRRGGEDAGDRPGFKVVGGSGGGRSVWRRAGEGGVVESGDRSAETPLCGWSGVVRTCATCGATGDAVLHTFSMLSLPLPAENRSLSSALLDAFASTDTGVEALCEMCGRNEPHVRRHSIARFPAVLALHLQKAYLLGGVVQGSGHATVFPETLVLPRGNPVPRVKRVRAGRNVNIHDTPRAGVVRYELRSVVQHCGGTGRGSHFVAMVCGGEGDGLAGVVSKKWWMVDDGRVSQCRREIALDPQKAYLLFYEREDE